MNRGNRRLRLFFHQPMPRIWNHHLRHIGGGGAHDDRHGRTEGLFAADGKDRHGQFTRRDEGLIVDRILVEGLELFERGMHGALAGVEFRVMLPRLFVKALRIGGEFVPEAVEIDPLAPGDQPFFIRAPKGKMPQRVAACDLVPGPIPGSGASSNANLLTRSGYWAAKA